MTNHAAEADSLLDGGAAGVDPTDERVLQHTKFAAYPQSRWLARTQVKAGDAGRDLLGPIQLVPTGGEYGAASARRHTAGSLAGGARVWHQDCVRQIP